MQADKATAARLGRPPGRSIENTARRRRQLIEAAIDSIVEHGFAATTLAKVSAAAGLSQGTAVFYFKTKESLLEETLRYHNETYRTVWQTALAHRPDMHWIRTLICRVQTELTAITGSSELCRAARTREAWRLWLEQPYQLEPLIWRQTENCRLC